jgi:hypothetical protein
MATAKGRLRTFRTADRSEVPAGRNGKHKSIVTKIVDDLDPLEKGRCLKIPLSDLPDTKANIRSALNRATRKLNKAVATKADDEFLYVWNS